MKKKLDKLYVEFEKKFPEKVDQIIQEFNRDKFPDFNSYTDQVLFAWNQMLVELANVHGFSLKGQITLTTDMYLMNFDRLTILKNGTFIIMQKEVQRVVNLFQPVKPSTRY